MDPMTKTPDDRSPEAVWGKPRVLVVDDEADIRELLLYNLSREGFDVQTARTGEEALELMRTAAPTLVILDLMLPGLSGLEVFRRMKSETPLKDIPVIILTAKTDDADVVLGLELGADDYVVKPFSPKVLAARIRTVLRRRTMAKSPPYQVGGLTLYPERFEARWEGRRLDLTATEFRILQLLMSRPGWVFTRERIVDAARGEDAAVTERAVDVHISALRRKLGAAAVMIETVRGVGYRVREEV